MKKESNINCIYYKKGKCKIFFTKVFKFFIVDAPCKLNNIPEEECKQQIKYKKPNFTVIVSPPKRR